MIKKILLLSTLLAAGISAGAKEMREITLVRDYYNETLKKIKNGSVYKRDIQVTYPVIPGVGPGASKVNIFYDMREGMDGRYEYGIVRIENYYQHTGKVLYEEFLYNNTGELMFYFGRIGTGDITRADGINWNSDERIYFWNGRAIRVMYGTEVVDRFRENDLKKIEAAVKQAGQLRDKDCQVSIPRPVLFQAE